MANEHILVVDDNAINIRLISYVLSTQGYGVAMAANAEEAFAALDRRLPDLILMDLQLPGMDGLELTRRLKADPRIHGIPIVALTAYARPSDEQSAREAGCDGYITKPFGIRSLQDSVAEYLAHRGAEACILRGG